MVTDYTPPSDPARKTFYPEFLFWNIAGGSSQTPKPQFEGVLLPPFITCISQVPNTLQVQYGNYTGPKGKALEQGQERNNSFVLRLLA